MRPLEAAYVGVLLVFLAVRWARPRSKQTSVTLAVMIALLAIIHMAVDGPRWEMIPAYLLGLFAIFVFRGDVVRGRRFADTPKMAGDATGEVLALPSPARRTLRATALVLSGIIAILLPLWLFPRVVFPRVTGFYPVGRIDAFWVDSTRGEPHTADPADKRGLWITAWYPAEEPSSELVPYTDSPSALADDLHRSTGLPAFVFTSLTHARTNATRAPQFSIREGRSPVLLFSHGMGSWRTQSTFEFEELASSGYVVVSIGHSYASAGTLLPGGKRAPVVAPDSLGTAGGQARELALWEGDAKFVLDRLNRLPVHDVTDTIARHMQLEKVGYAGHSFGGATVVETLVHDHRIRAGIDYDGFPWGTAWEQGSDRPFLVFRAAPRDPAKMTEAQLTDAGTTRDSMVKHAAEFDRRVASLLKFGGTEIRLDGATHVSFSDLPRWSPPLARRLGLAGADDPSDVNEAISALTLRFFDRWLKGNDKENEVDLPRQVQVRVVPHQATAK